MKTAFKDYFQELIGEKDAQLFFEAIEKKETRRALRVNSLRTDLAFMREWLDGTGYEVNHSPFSRDGLEIVGRGERWALKLPYHAGFTYPQDPSSMYAVELLDPQPGETVIDLTAAPGGKTTHIAQRMENKGVLVANDMDKKRLRALHSNLERLGIWNTIVMRGEPFKLSQWYPETFDRVLLDPSCSGEGLLVTYDGKPSYWSSKGLKKYAAMQFGLLCSAFQMLKPGGRLVYSTCTLNAAEDDGVVERLLKKFPEAQIVNVEVPGTPEQLGELKGVRFWPQITQTKGFFCIAITKTDSTCKPAENEFKRTRTLKRKDHPRYLKTVKKQYGEVPETELVHKDGHIFLVSREVGYFEAHPYASLSLPFFKLNERRLTHAGALIMGAMNPEKCLELQAEELEAFFGGESLEWPEEEALHLLRFGSFPLGIAQAEKGQLRPLIPHMY